MSEISRSIVLCHIPNNLPVSGPPDPLQLSNHSVNRITLHTIPCAVRFSGRPILYLVLKRHPRVISSISLASTTIDLHPHATTTSRPARYYGGFLLPEKYILFERSKNYTSDLPRKSEVYFFQKKRFLRFFKEICGTFFLKKKISLIFQGYLSCLFQKRYLRFS